MVHLVYCDNTGKKGEHELDKILNGSKTMVVRGAVGRKIPHSIRISVVFPAPFAPRSPYTP